MKMIVVMGRIDYEAEDMWGLEQLEEIQAESKFLLHTGEIIPVLPQVMYLGWGEIFQNSTMMSMYSRLISKADGILLLGGSDSATAFAEDCARCYDKPVFFDSASVYVWASSEGRLAN